VRFYNGTPQNTQLDAMTAVASDPQWTQTYTDVHPHVRTCTYVLQLDTATNALVYTGFRSPVGQAHDAVAW
jgi:hypothetical protein